LGTSGNATFVESPVGLGVGVALSVALGSLVEMVRRRGAGRWIPEAARLLRPGGRLTFLRNSTLLMLCEPETGPATDRLLRPQAGLHQMSWESDPGVEFHLGPTDWMASACRRVRAGPHIVAGWHLHALSRTPVHATIATATHVVRGLPARPTGRRSESTGHGSGRPLIQLRRSRAVQSATRGLTGCDESVGVR
jgi:hypothetical protein